MCAKQPLTEAWRTLAYTILLVDKLRKSFCAFYVLFWLWDSNSSFLALWAAEWICVHPRRSVLQSPWEISLCLLSTGYPVREQGVPVRVLTQWLSGMWILLGCSDLGRKDWRWPGALAVKLLPDACWVHSMRERRSLQPQLAVDWAFSRTGILGGTQLSEAFQDLVSLINPWVLNPDNGPISHLSGLPLKYVNSKCL